jgi:hypothetical protein
MTTSSARQLGHVLSDGLQERGFEVDDSAEDGTGDYYFSLFNGRDFVGSYRVTPEGKLLSIGDPSPLATKAIKDMGLGSRLGKEKQRCIAVHFAVITPESAEQGDFDETGEERVDDIEPMYDETFADAAIKYLEHEGAGFAEGSDWFETEGYTDHRTGAETLYSYHLEGFTDAEKKRSDVASSEHIDDV